jgi:hypothetical protein
MVLLLRFLPLLLIIIAAVIFWKFYLKQTSEEEDKQQLPWYKKSWIWLILSIVIVSLLTAVISVIMDSRTHTQGNYVPAHYDNSVFVPGHYE